ncbi:hypothetical protein RAJCM14343_4745 [Rhodococcus aetherivorans]|uniref:Uncharacterized protein n=1 Tax=Rhodococcus aetherivorans TaxID=191292 RepID=A0ABQ0YSA3_9NOCA|nr:hypothetical protein RAJCM14343_4745 [Rhodococcus aetherivorans]
MDIVVAPGTPTLGVTAYRTPPPRADGAGVFVASVPRVRAHAGAESLAACRTVR